jgi:hypothetical protein
MSVASAATDDNASSKTKLDCSKGFEALFEEAGRRNVTVDNNPTDWTIVTADNAHQIYAFTKKNHYAYPSVVLRTIVERDNAIYVEMDGCGYGEKEKFNRVMREFEVLNEQMRKALGSGPGK